MDNRVQKSNDAYVQSTAFIASIVICVLLGGGFITSIFLRLKQPNTVRMEQKINPNSASEASLARLPGIGVIRATKIVEYRQNFVKTDANRPAFQNADDLRNVKKGIGAKTVKNMSEWLKFE